jgi:hypothetical protein
MPSNILSEGHVVFEGMSQYHMVFFEELGSAEKHRDGIIIFQWLR